MYKILTSYSIKLKTTAISIFARFGGFGVAFVKEKWHLESPLTRACRYRSACETYKIISNGSRGTVVSLTVHRKKKKKKTF